MEARSTIMLARLLFVVGASSASSCGGQIGDTTGSTRPSTSGAGASGGAGSGGVSSGGSGGSAGMVVGTAGSAGSSGNSGSSECPSAAGAPVAGLMLVTACYEQWGDGNAILPPLPMCPCESLCACPQPALIPYLAPSPSSPCASVIQHVNALVQSGLQCSNPGNCVKCCYEVEVPVCGVGRILLIDGFNRLAEVVLRGDWAT